MIIGIFDVPRFNRDIVTQELEKNDVIVLRDNPIVFQEKSESILKKNPKTLIAWDYPTFLHEECSHLVDKVLHIQKFHKSLNEEESKWFETFDNSDLFFYNIAIAEKAREKTAKDAEERNTFMRKSINHYVKEWKEEMTNPNFLSDKIISDISQEMISNLDKKPLILSRCDAGLSCSSRYLDWLGQIVNNPTIMRWTGCDEKEIRIILAHELGHFSDTDLPKLNQEEREIWKKLLSSKTEEEIDSLLPSYLEVTLRQENNAFDLCYNFLPPNLHSLVENRRNKNEQGYKHLILVQKKRFLLKHLKAHH